jgi:hypothetical protein
MPLELPGIRKKQHSKNNNEALILIKNGKDDRFAERNNIGINFVLNKLETLIYFF